MNKRWRALLHLPAILLGICALPQAAPAQRPAAAAAKNAAKNTPSSRGATPEADLAASLQLFTKLGLPSSKGAVWVRAHIIFDRYDRSRDRGLVWSPLKPYSGDSWWLSEGKNGTAELLINQSQRLTVRLRYSNHRRAPGDDAALPLAQMLSSSLDEDTALLAETLTVQDAVGNQSERPEMIRRGGDTLLFIAHLHQQGRHDAVAKLLPKLLKVFPKP